MMTRFRTISVKGSLRCVDKLGKGNSFFCACLSPTIARVPAHSQTLLNPLPGLCLRYQNWTVPLAHCLMRIQNLPDQARGWAFLGRGHRKSYEARTSLTFLWNFQSAWSFINKGKVTGDTDREAGKDRATGRELDFITSQQGARSHMTDLHVHKISWLLCRE